MPDQDRGRLIEVEHLARYRWAAQVVPGRSVLDAGCGTAYGSRMLAHAGAREVVGVDIAAPVLQSVATEMPGEVRLRPGDLRRCELPDDHFDVVVCFEVIEHVEDPLAVLDELVRVLAPGGVLLISSPNRGVYPPDNPHHRHEFTATELAAALSARLGHVRLHRQHDFILSAVLSDADFARGDGDAVDDLRLHKLVAGAPGAELYTLAVAGDAELPQLRGLGDLTGPLELARWMSVFEEQTAAVAHRDATIDELRGRISERDQLAARLLDAEQRLVALPAQELRITELEAAVLAAHASAEDAWREVAQLDQMLMYGRRALRYVRPLIGPLRRVRRALRNR